MPYSDRELQERRIEQGRDKIERESKEIAERTLWYFMLFDHILDSPKSDHPHPITMTTFLKRFFTLRSSLFSKFEMMMMRRIGNEFWEILRIWWKSLLSLSLSLSQRILCLTVTVELDFAENSKRKCRHAQLQQRSLCYHSLFLSIAIITHKQHTLKKITSFSSFSLSL